MKRENIEWQYQAAKKAALTEGQKLIKLLIEQGEKAEHPAGEDAAFLDRLRHADSSSLDGVLPILTAISEDQLGDAVIRHQAEVCERADNERYRLDRLRFA